MRTTPFKTNSNTQQIREETKTLILDSFVEKIELELDCPRIITIFGLDRKSRIRQWHLKITNKGNLVLV